MPANALLAPLSSLRIDSSLAFGRHRQRSRLEALICAVAKPSTAPPAGTSASSNGNVVVVGGGWAGDCSCLYPANRSAASTRLPGDHPALRFAGFGAAKHLAETGYNVTLLDAAPNPGGLSAGWRTPQGRAVEAGIKGFWYQACLVSDYLLVSGRPKVRQSNLTQHVSPTYESLVKLIKYTGESEGSPYGSCLCATWW